MFDDWTAAPGPAVSGILRVYSTTYFDEVTGSRLDITSVPGFVARTRIQSILALPSHHAPPSDVGRAEMGEFIAEVHALAAGVLGSEARPCATVGAKPGFGNDSSNFYVLAAAEAAGVRFVSESLAFDTMLGRSEHSAFRRQLEADTVVVEQSPPEMMSAATLLAASAVGATVGGVGGVFVTALGGLLGVVLNRSASTLADEIGIQTGRVSRRGTEDGRQRNRLEELRRTKEELILEEEIAELTRRKSDRAMSTRAVE